MPLCVGPWSAPPLGPSQAGQGSRDGGHKNEDKNGLGARAKQLKSRKAGPDNERGAWETSARSTCG